MKPQTDWEAIEREYRAGQLSVREIGRIHGVTEGAIRKRAKADGWARALAEKVRTAVREKLVRADGTQNQRASDQEIVETAALRGLAVVTTHRRDLEQLHGLKRILAERLSVVLTGGTPDGVCLGDKESPGDLLEKLSRVTARLIPLERQAHSLDKGVETEPADSRAGMIDARRLTPEQREMMRQLIRVGTGEVIEGKVISTREG